MLNFLIHRDKVDYFYMMGKERQCLESEDSFLCLLVPPYSIIVNETLQSVGADRTVIPSDLTLPGKKILSGLGDGRW